MTDTTEHDEVPVGRRTSGTGLGSRGEAPDWGAHYGISELWSEIVPGLWVGGTDDEDVVRNEEACHAEPAITKDDFDAVVTLYAWARPVDWFVEEYRWGIMDGADALDTLKLLSVIEWAHERWSRGERVLMRCQAGLNRSSLIAAGVLILDGKSAEDAISLIRTGRSRHALFNREFVQTLKSLERAGIASE